MNNELQKQISLGNFALACEKALEIIDHQAKEIEVLKAKAKMRWQPIKKAPTKGSGALYIWGPNFREPQKAYTDTWWQSGHSAESKPTHFILLPEPPINKETK